MIVVIVDILLAIVDDNRKQYINYTSNINNHKFSTHKTTFL